MVHKATNPGLASLYALSFSTKTNTLFRLVFVPALVLALILVQIPVFVLALALVVVLVPFLLLSLTGFGLILCHCNTSWALLVPWKIQEAR